VLRFAPLGDVGEVNVVVAQPNNRGSEQITTSWPLEEFEHGSDSGVGIKAQIGERYPILVDSSVAMERYKDDPQPLIAAYLVSRDPVLLEFALERHPDDPVVLLTKLLSNGRDEALNVLGNEDLIERLKMNDPSNPLPFLLSALRYLQSGNVESMIKEIDAIPEGGVNTYRYEFTSGMIRLMEDNGYSELGALYYAVEHPLAPYPTPANAMSELTSTVQSAIEDAVAKGESANELARLGVGIAEVRASTGELSDKLIAIGLKKRFLPYLEDSHLSTEE
jgi:hypothetical protein